MAGKTYKQLTQVQKVFKASTEEKKIFFGNYEVFSSAHEVTYYIDTGNVVVLEIDDEDDIIANAPTATKAGWTLVGWRQDTQADPNVIHSLPATEDNMAVYAVFQQTVTVSLVGGDSVVRNSGTRYYNNGTYRNPSIQLGYATKASWTLTGYRADTQATYDVSYIAGRNYIFTGNTTLYAVFQQTIVVKVTIKGITVTNPLYKYYNNGNYNYPQLVKSDPTMDDAVFDGYSTSPTDTTIAIPTLNPPHTFQESTNLYAVWTYNSALLFQAPSIDQGNLVIREEHTGLYALPNADNTGDFEYNGVKYATISVTLKASASVGGAATQNNVWMDLQDGGQTFVLHAGRGSQQGQWEEGPCADGASATVDVICSNQNPTKLYGLINGDVWGYCSFRVSRIYGNGRTLVY